MSYFPGMLFRYSLNDFEMVPFASVVTAITLSFKFHLLLLLLFNLTELWRCHQELHDLFYSPNHMRVIKLRRVRWTGYAIGTGGEKCTQGVVG